jgi:superfamily II DNA/RNA helicase
MDGRLFDPDTPSFLLPDGSHLWNLDPRLVKALKKTLAITKPTLVQSQVIPIALEGKDVLVRSRTGSGKTLAFLLPLVQKILSTKVSLTYNSL